MFRLVTLSLLLAACADSDDGDGAPTTTPEATPTDVKLVLTNISTPGSLVPASTGVPADHSFAPGIAVVHDDLWALFAMGSPVDPGLEALAEDGDNAPLIDTLTSAGAVDATSFAAEDETYADAPMEPGDEAELWIRAAPGDHVTVAAMLGQSNDWFVSVAPGGVPLFDDAGQVRVGEHTAELRFYDAGSEVSQEYGAGPDQAARQSAPGQGEDEGGGVTEVTELPPVDTLLRFEIRVDDGAADGA